MLRPASGQEFEVETKNKICMDSILSKYLEDKPHQGEPGDELDPMNPDNLSQARINKVSQVYCYCLTSSTTA